MRTSEARNTLHLPKIPAVKAEPVSRDAIIRVVVKLPTGDIKLEFVKRNVMANASASQLNERTFAAAIQRGLEGILGGVQKL